MNLESGPRLTRQTLKVLEAFIQQPSEEIAGSDIARQTQLLSGSLYPILARLEGALWVESRWEDADPRELGRPRKRLYRLTEMGVRRTQAALMPQTKIQGSLAWMR
jgi:PadR family transcriptional regulator, regulatory protein PadR